MMLDRLEGAKKHMTVLEKSKKVGEELRRGAACRHVVLSNYQKLGGKDSGYGQALVRGIRHCNVAFSISGGGVYPWLMGWKKSLGDSCCRQTTL